jgi:hypothetical protein
VGISSIGTLKGSALAWALAGALRWAIATAIVALLLAASLPDTDAERFATTAYLAGIFAAIVLAVKWLACGDLVEVPRRFVIPTFPNALGFSLGIVVLLVAGSGLADDPGGEVRLILYCLIAVAGATVARAGAFGWLHARIREGGWVASARRYCALGAIAALVLSALLESWVAEFFAVLAYVSAASAMLLSASALFAAAPLGGLIRQRLAAARATVDQLSNDSLFARLIEWATLATVASLVMAALLRRPYSEPFAAIAYVAAVFATVGIAMECRRTARKRSVKTP